MQIGSHYFLTNSNHHVVIYTDEAGKVRAEVVSMLEAAMRIGRREPIVRRSLAGGTTFNMSLSIGDMLERGGDGKKEYWVVVQLEQERLMLQRHNAAKGLERTRPGYRSLVKEGARKVIVDASGRVFYAND